MHARVLQLHLRKGRQRKVAVDLVGVAKHRADRVGMAKPGREGIELVADRVAPPEGPWALGGWSPARRLSVLKRRSGRRAAKRGGFFCHRFWGVSSGGGR